MRAAGTFSIFRPRPSPELPGRWRWVDHPRCAGRLNAWSRPLITLDGRRALTLAADRIALEAAVGRVLVLAALRQVGGGSAGAPAAVGVLVRMLGRRAERRVVGA